MLMRKRCLSMVNRFIVGTLLLFATCQLRRLATI